MAKDKAPRNKTIDTTLEAGRHFLERCLTIGNEAWTYRQIVDKTILGDALQVVQKLPENSVDLLIADPPYNLTKVFNGRVFGKKKVAEYRDYTRQWLAAVKPLLKKTASLYVCCDWQTSLIIGPIIEEQFVLRNRITWQREKGRGAKSNWKNGLEDIWYATVSGDYTFNLDAVKLRKRVIAPYRVDGKPKDWQETAAGNFRDTCPSNFWDDITIPFWSMPENTAHPTQKPEKLIAKLILASSKPGDLVFDPFLGSGTTSVVARKLGRQYLGVERDPQYCVWAEQRLADARRDASIQGYDDGVFWQRNTSRRGNR